MNPFDTTGFPARWFCGSAWAEYPWVGWLHIFSDLVIFAAYFAVPVVVMYFVRQRNNLKFPPIFYIFLGLIFFSCGTVHLIEAGIFWWPIYKFSGMVKFVTASVSAAGVIMLVRVLPTALDLKSGAAYAVVVDERRKAIEMLKYEQFLLRTMMKNMPDLIYFKDTASRFTLISDSLAEFLGADSPESVVGKTDYDFFPIDFADEARADEVNLMQTREPIIGKEEPEHSASGKDVWLSSTKLPLYDESGEVIGLFGLSRDITPQKQVAEVMTAAKEAAEASSHAKSDFLANMSHEIRTPMNSIMGMTELVLDSDLTPTQQNYLSIVYESAESLLTVINEILDFSKIEAGVFELVTEDIALRDEIGDTLKSLALRADAKGIELAWHVHSDVPDCFEADSVRLRQVLVNLVGNAIKFTSQGEVVVEVKQEEALADAVRLHFIVSDTGIGIPDEKLATVFDAFEQADSSTTRQFGGTGLGLAIAQKIVQAMNGRIWAESQPGIGSQFHFVIELAYCKTPPETTSLWDLDLTKIPVVIVDDNDTNRRILTEILQSWNMKVRAAENALDAINAIYEIQKSEKTLPLLISDVHMPEMDGFTLAEKIRSSEDLKETSIILLTSGSHADDPLRCQELGISVHMMKPVKPSELMQAIIRALGRTPQPTQLAEDPLDSKVPVERSLSILLAEDGYANQKLATAMLNRWGHRTTVAENGQQAVDLWRDGSFDLILMDVQMPVMDGLEATRKIRELELEARLDAHIPIIAMTARAMKGDRESCLESGMDSYISKPIRRKIVFEAIESLVSVSGNITSDEDRKTHSTPSDDEQVSDAVVDWSVALTSVEGDQEILMSIVQAALEEVPVLIATLNDALQTDDVQAANRSAHSIKSIAVTFGAKDLHEYARKMEADAEAGLLEDVKKRQPKFNQLVEQFLNALNQRTSSPD